jgi:hypothetical protein
VTEQELPLDYFNNLNPADFLEQSMILTIYVDMEDTEFDSLAVCGNVAPLDWDFAAHNNPLTLHEGTIWTTDITFMEGAYRYLGFKFATDGQDLEAGFDENHTCTLDESEMSQTVWCVYGEMGPTTNNNENSILPAGSSIVNYPNPFNPQTNISYQLPDKMTGELSIYNLKGQKVKTFSGLQGSGSLSWLGDDQDGNTLASGIYLAVIRSGKFTESTKMILLK